MKTLCVLGSPRPKGNSSALAKHFCTAMEQLGSEVQTISLNALTYRGCQACMGCKTRADRCVLQDDLTPVLAAICEADVLVVATPVYFGDVPSQLKGLLDRMYSFLVPDYRENPHRSRLPPGKKLVFIQVQGRADVDKFADVFPRYAEFLDWYGIRERYLIRDCRGRKPGEIQTFPDTLTAAEDVARTIMGS
ncbi:MAG TPA: flavodoxin family protein [Deferrisomatales bacterium]|nr:flavodoxin family protein [Deferrisomatales bacterium]